MSRRCILGWLSIFGGLFVVLAATGLLIASAVAARGGFAIARTIVLLAAGALTTWSGVRVVRALPPDDGLVVWLRTQLTAIHVLVLVAALEVVINRVAVPMLRPTTGDPPTWHTALDYLGLFLFYFAGTLAVFVIVTRSISAIQARRGTRDAVAHAILAAAAVLCAIPLVVATPAWLVFVLELAFAGALVALLTTVYTRGRDLGIRIGLPIILVPLLLHTANVGGARLVWQDSTFDGPGPDIARLGLLALCFAALVTPYCFAPRPFARAVTRPFPVVFAMLVAAIGALVSRLSYPAAAKVASLAVGVEMSYTKADPRLALYLLAIATFAWTLASCATATTAARRSVGAGLALIVLGGYAFKWPHHYLLPLLGFALIVDAARRVRDEELAAMPIVAEAPPIADTTWSTYIGNVVAGLRRTLSDVHSLTTRGDGGLASSVIVGDAAGTTMRARIERIEGSVLALDVVLGREVDELRGATLSIWAIPERAHGTNPAGPPATPQFRTGDASFDLRFKTRGSAPAFARLFDDGLRARAVATLDGWLAFWEREGMRYRVYPGRGAPLDHPMPLSDLAMGKVPPTAERLVAVIELLLEVAARGIEPARPQPEPAELDSTEIMT